MSEIKFRTSWNYKPHSGADYSDEVSLTQPDQAYTLRQLISQFATGVREFEELIAGHDEEPDWDELSPLNNHRLDLSDYTAEQYALSQKHLKALENKKKLEEHKALLEEEEVARLEARKKWYAKQEDDFASYSKGEKAAASAASE